MPHRFLKYRGLTFGKTQSLNDSVQITELAFDSKSQEKMEYSIKINRLFFCCQKFVRNKCFIILAVEKMKMKNILSRIIHSSCGLPHHSRRCWHILHDSSKAYLAKSFSIHLSNCQIFVSWNLWNAQVHSSRETRKVPFALLGVFRIRATPANPPWTIWLYLVRHSLLHRLMRT